MSYYNAISKNGKKILVNGATGRLGTLIYNRIPESFVNKEGKWAPLISGGLPVRYDDKIGVHQNK